MFRILVIDDNPAIHHDFRRILTPEQSGDAVYDAAAALILGEPSPKQENTPTYHVDTALQGQDGLAMVEAALTKGEPYAMAFIDIRMPPGWDGLETLSRLWEVDPNLQAVLCTAYSDYSWRDVTRRLARPNHLLILKKPFDSTEALQMATLLTEKWQSARTEAAQRQTLDALLETKTQEASSAYELAMQSEERFGLAFQSSPIALGILDEKELQWVSYNLAFQDLTSWSHPQPLQGLFVLEGQDQALHKLLSDEHIRKLPSRILPQPGFYRDVLISRERFIVQGRTYLLLTIEDVTHVVETEHRLRLAQRMEAVGQLAAGVAHDFNNIMTVVLGQLSTSLQEPTLTPPVKESLVEARLAGLRAASLTSQLLSFGRRQIVRPEAHRSTKLIQQQAGLLPRLIGEHITLQLDLASQLPNVLVDTNCFNQILLNLAINARDAMPNGGTIVLAAKPVVLNDELARNRRDAKAGRFLRLSFTDTGIGMDANTREHLFEPFFTTKAQGEGSGLGLSMVYGIMAQHGGWVECDSRPGVGTTFHLYFPIAPRGMAPVNIAGSDSPHASPEGHGSTILVVEDEAPIRNMLCAILKRFGFDVLPAGDAAEALEIWQNPNSIHIDALFTDIVMPGGMSGLNLAKRLLEDRPDLRIVFSSGYSQELLHCHASLGDFGLYLPKPYEMSGVARILAELFPPASEPAAHRLESRNAVHEEASLLS
jgi:two-component system, cell cycle sensor histidine kinase and response regulator CckA